MAVRVAVVDVSCTEFDVIICDIHMPVVNGEQVARMIRSTNNHNQNTPSESGSVSDAMVGRLHADFVF
jgi:CheY-like chemotaxis protein